MRVPQTQISNPVSSVLPYFYLGVNPNLNPYMFGLDPTLYSHCILSSLSFFFFFSSSSHSLSQVNQVLSLEHGLCVVFSSWIKEKAKRLPKNSQRHKRLLSKSQWCCKLYKKIMLVWVLIVIHLLFKYISTYLEE